MPNDNVIRAILVDDEPLAHDVLMHHLANLDVNVSVVKQCFSATEALSWLAHEQVDLMFLDINMPGLSGIELLKVMANRPQVILVSAYQEYALQGFELDVTDYLLKPVSEKRLAGAIKKVRQRASRSAVEPQQSIIVQVDRTQQKLFVKDIVYLEAYGNYVKVWLDDDMLLVSSTLKQLLDVLHDACMQVHKSYAILRERVVAVDKECIHLKKGEDKVSVKVGKSFKGDAKALLLTR